MVWVGLSNLQAAAQNSSKQSPSTVVVITKYEVKEGNQDKVKKALKNYVRVSSNNEQNIMAKAYNEEGHTKVLWVIERWKSQLAYERFRNTAACKAIAAFTKDVLPVKPLEIFVNDLEPVSKKQWRTTANATDKPLTIMLFVDAKPGTEDRFKKIYHEAMPKFRSEPGVINYQLSQFKQDKTQFVTYEHFRNEAAFQYHLNFPPIKPVIEYLHTSIKKQPFETGLHRLVEF